MRVEILEYEEYEDMNMSSATQPFDLSKCKYFKIQPQSNRAILIYTLLNLQTVLRCGLL